MAKIVKQNKKNEKFWGENRVLILNIEVTVDRLHLHNNI